VSGLVRRAQRRIYIDLEPLSPTFTARLGGSSVLDAPDASKAAAPVTEPLNSSAASPAPATGAKIVTPRTAAVRPGPATIAAPTAVPAPPSSPDRLLPAPDEILRRAALLARQSDVKALEKLKLDLLASRAAAGTAAPPEQPDPIIDRVDQSLDEARKRRLLTDARLFKGDRSSGVAAFAPAALPAAPGPDEPFRPMINPLIPELERVSAMLSEWQPDFVPSPNVPQSLEALTLRLRVVRPPSRLSAVHERLCLALGTLAKSWVPAPDGVSVIPISPRGTDPRLIVNAKVALIDYLQGVAVESRSRFAPQAAPPS
jgi:hypothetical protein